MNIMTMVTTTTPELLRVSPHNQKPLLHQPPYVPTVFSENTHLTFHFLKELDIFGYVDQRAAASPGLAHLDEWPHQIPAFGEPATEILRRLANRYLNLPETQVDMVRMEPGQAGRIRVVITLELADF